MLVAIAAVLLAACGDAREGSSPPTASTAPLQGPPAVSVHQVRSSAPCGTDPAAAVPDRNNGLCFELGPAFVLGDDLVEPTVEFEDDAFSVVVSIADAARDRADESFDECFAGGAGCPAFEGGHGAAAIVLDGVVESAPVIEQEGQAAEGLVIRGDVTEDDAYRIVASLER